jgi:hypothetical protein
MIFFEYMILDYSYGDIALFDAIQDGRSDVAQYYILKKRELNLKETNKNGKTAFDVAVEKGTTMF